MYAMKYLVIFLLTIFMMLQAKGYLIKIQRHNGYSFIQSDDPGKGLEISDQEVVFYDTKTMQFKNITANADMEHQSLIPLCTEQRNEIVCADINCISTMPYVCQVDPRLNDITGLNSASAEVTQNGNFTIYILENGLATIKTAKLTGGCNIEYIDGVNFVLHNLEGKSIGFRYGVSYMNYQETILSSIKGTIKPLMKHAIQLPVYRELDLEIECGSSYQIVKNRLNLAARCHLAYTWEPIKYMCHNSIYIFSLLTMAMGLVTVYLLRYRPSLFNFWVVLGSVAVACTTTYFTHLEHKWYNYLISVGIAILIQPLFFIIYLICCLLVSPISWITIIMARKLPKWVFCNGCGSWKLKPHDLVYGHRHCKICWCGLDGQTLHSCEMQKTLRFPIVFRSTVNFNSGMILMSILVIVISVIVNLPVSMASTNIQDYMTLQSLTPSLNGSKITGEFRTEPTLPFAFNWFAYVMAYQSMSLVEYDGQDFPESCHIGTTLTEIAKHKDWVQHLLFSITIVSPTGTYYCNDFLQDGDCRCMHLSEIIDYTDFNVILALVDKYATMYPTTINRNVSTLVGLWIALYETQAINGLPGDIFDSNHGVVFGDEFSPMTAGCSYLSDWTFICTPVCVYVESKPGRSFKGFSKLDEQFVRESIIVPRDGVLYIQPTVTCYFDRETSETLYFIPSQNGLMTWDYSYMELLLLNDLDKNMTDFAKERLKFEQKLLDGHNFGLAWARYPIVEMEYWPSAMIANQLANAIILVGDFKVAHGYTRMYNVIEAHIRNTYDTTDPKELKEYEEGDVKYPCIKFANKFISSMQYKDCGFKLKKPAANSNLLKQLTDFSKRLHVPSMNNSFLKAMTIYDEHQQVLYHPEYVMSQVEFSTGNSLSARLNDVLGIFSMVIASFYLQKYHLLILGMFFMMTVINAQNLTVEEVLGLNFRDAQSVAPAIGQISMNPMVFYSQGDFGNTYEYIFDLDYRSGQGIDGVLDSVSKDKFIKPMTVQIWFEDAHYEDVYSYQYDSEVSHDKIMLGYQRFWQYSQCKPGNEHSFEACALHPWWYRDLKPHLLANRMITSFKSNVIHQGEKPTIGDRMRFWHAWSDREKVVNCHDLYCGNNVFDVYEMPHYLCQICVPSQYMPFDFVTWNSAKHTMAKPEMATGLTRNGLVLKLAESRLRFKMCISMNGKGKCFTEANMNGDSISFGEARVRIAQANYEKNNMIVIRRSKTSGPWNEWDSLPQEPEQGQFVWSTKTPQGCAKHNASAVKLVEKLFYAGWREKVYWVDKAYDVPMILTGNMNDLGESNKIYGKPQWTFRTLADADVVDQTIPVTRDSTNLILDCTEDTHMLYKNLRDVTDQYEKLNFDTLAKDVFEGKKLSLKRKQDLTFSSRVRIVVPKLFFQHSNKQQIDQALEEKNLVQISNIKSIGCVSCEEGTAIEVSMTAKFHITVGLNCDHGVTDMRSIALNPTHQVVKFTAWSDKISQECHLTYYSDPFLSFKFDINDTNHKTILHNFDEIKSDWEINIMKIDRSGLDLNIIDGIKRLGEGLNAVRTEIGDQIVKTASGGLFSSTGEVIKTILYIIGGIIAVIIIIVLIVLVWNLLSSKCRRRTAGLGRAALTAIPQTRPLMMASQIGDFSKFWPKNVKND